MRHPEAISPRTVILLLCAAIMLLLVLAEGWTWPLKVAAVLIPVSYLIG